MVPKTKIASFVGMIFPSLLMVSVTPNVHHKHLTTWQTLSSFRRRSGMHHTALMTALLVTILIKLLSSASLATWIARLAIVLRLDLAWPANQLSISMMVYAWLTALSHIIRIISHPIDVNRSVRLSSLRSRSRVSDTSLRYQKINRHICVPK